MRKIIVFNNVSLDGFMSGPHGELDWAIHDDEVTQNVKDNPTKIDTYLFGRVTYQMFASFWSTPAAESFNPLFAKLLNNTSKIVFSRTLQKADWENTTVVKELNKENILKMKRAPGNDMMLFGSGSIVGQLTNWELIDEYQLMVNPIILGEGKPLFKDLKRKMKLKLVKTKIFNNGIALLQYQPYK